MSQQSLQREFVARVAELHIAGRDIKFWTLAVSRIAARAQEDSAPFEAFHNFVARFVPPAPSGPLGFDLADLSDPQKWLVMVTVAEFLDQEIIFHQEYESWRRVWGVATNEYARAFDYLCSHPDVLNPRLRTSWDTFRAAVS